MVLGVPQVLLALWRTSCFLVIGFIGHVATVVVMPFQHLVQSSTPAVCYRLLPVLDGGRQD